MFNHIKRLICQVLIYGLGDTLNRIISILILPIFTQYLTPADYGVASILIVTNTLVTGFAEMGLTSAVFRFYIDEKPINKEKIVVTAQIAMVFLTFLFALISIPLSGNISQLFFKTSAYSNLVILNFFTIPLTTILTIPLARLRILEKAKLYTFLNVLRVITGLVINLILIVVLGRGLRGLFEGSLINALLYGFIIGIYSLKVSGFSFSKELFLKMLRFSYPFVLNSISFWIINWADRFILAKLSNLSEVGLYTLGYSIGLVIVLPVGAFATAFTPYYMSVAHQKNAKQIYALIFTYYSLVMGFFVLLLAVFGRDYFYFFTKAEFHGAASVIPLIAFAYALRGNFSISSVGAYVKRKTGFVVLVEFLAMIINITLMFILIPTFGRLGAAWATAASYLALPILMLLFTRKYYLLPYQYKRIFQIIFISLGLYYFCQFLYYPSWTNLFLRVGIIILFYPFSFFILGFFDKSELKRFHVIKLKIFRQEVVNE